MGIWEYLKGEKEKEKFDYIIISIIKKYLKDRKFLSDRQ